MSTNAYSPVQRHASEVDAPHKPMAPPLAPQEEEKNRETKTPSEEDKQ